MITHVKHNLAVAGSLACQVITSVSGVMLHLVRNRVTDCCANAIFLLQILSY
jgi:hypothetical protein